MKKFLVIGDNRTIDTYPTVKAKSAAEAEQIVKQSYENGPTRFVPLKTIEIKDGTPTEDINNIIKEEVTELTNQLKEDEQ